MTAINKQRILESFLHYVSIDAPSLSERTICDELKKELISLGAEVFEDNAAEATGADSGNIIANFKGTVDGSYILLSAHMDSVSPCEGVKPVLKDGKIYSDGTTVLGADDKAGIAAILEAIKTIKENKIDHAPFQVIFTIAEEIGKGAQNIDKSLLKAEYGYVFDADGAPGQIITKAPGAASINARIYGKSAHAGMEPEKGNNAIIAAGKILAAMPASRIDEETTCNIGTIKGGTARNIVADYVEIQGEVRSRNKNKLKYLTNEIRNIFYDSSALSRVRAEVDVELTYEAFSLESSSKVVQLAVKAAGSLDFAVNITSTGGGSDANWFNLFGIPCALMGVGMKNVHTKEEYISQEDLYNSAAYVAQIIIEAAG